MIININDNEIELKRTMRAIIIYEAIADKAFAPKTTTDIIYYLYATVMASKPGTEITFDDFIEWLDNNPSAVGEFSEWLIKANDVDAQFSTKKKETKRVTKKKS